VSRTKAPSVRKNKSATSALPVTSHRASPYRNKVYFLFLLSTQVCMCHPNLFFNCWFSLGWSFTRVSSGGVVFVRLAGNKLCLAQFQRTFPPNGASGFTLFSFCDLCLSVDLSYVFCGKIHSSFV
jgi:hypothetical protein